MKKADLLEQDEVLAYQIDVFDNEANRLRQNREKKPNATDFTVSLRLETENTDGWLNLQSQITVGRKPSQTKRSIRTKVDLDIFKQMVAYREDFHLTNKVGFDIKPVISSFYKKQCKSEGMIPSFYCMFLKETNEEHSILLQFGNWREYILLTQKTSDTHTIYSAQERFRYTNEFKRRGY
jgi:hypothetical protein|tara:strand:- start:158 stop:697 length:540 start_codon:yes stop_codon:yes gene_type:complete